MMASDLATRVSGGRRISVDGEVARRATATVQGVVIAVACVMAGLGVDVARGAPGDGDHYGIPQVKFINQQISAGWADANLKPSEPATDGEWCRRVFLDVIGRVPSVEELQKFVADPSSNKRPQLVDRLLGDEYVDDYARNWTDIWTTVLIGRDVQNERVSRPGMRQYLRRAFSKNLAYDRFMEELVTATGASANRANAQNFNGAVNFLSGKM